MKLLIISEGKNELHGALPVLVQRLLARTCSYDVKKISDHDLRVHAGKGNCFTKKAIRCLVHASERGYDGVVVVIDQDNDRSRIGQFQKAQEHQQNPIPRALGIAVRTFDAWMLADEVAIATAVGQAVQKQPDPESMSDPKTVGMQLKSSLPSLGLSDLYLAIAQAARLEVLLDRCPTGFAPFARYVRTLPAARTDEAGAAP